MYSSGITEATSRNSRRFFSNSTAHYQHSYWRCMEPSRFEVSPSEEEIKRYGGAILFGYQNMDRLLERFLKMERDGILLILLSALSQQPFLKYEKIGGQRFYRLKDVDGFLKRLGLTPSSSRPVMTHQYLLHFPDQETRDHATKRLRQVSVDGEVAFQVDPMDGNKLYFGCQIRSHLGTDARLSIFQTHHSYPAFFDVFYQIDGIKSGCHHPDGILWFKTGQHTQHAGKTSILNIFPTVLECYGVEQHGKSETGQNGVSLIPKMVLPSHAAAVF